MRSIAHFSIRICAEASQIRYRSAELEVRRACLSVKRFGMEGNMRILMFDIDTLRADHMGCYGYGRNTTPNMDRVAEEGVRFDRYYCPNAPCLPSRASRWSAVSMESITAS